MANYPRLRFTFRCDLARVINLICIVLQVQGRVFTVCQEEIVTNEIFLSYIRRRVLSDEEGEEARESCVVEGISGDECISHLQSHYVHYSECKYTRVFTITGGQIVTIYGSDTIKISLSIIDALVSYFWTFSESPGIRLFIPRDPTEFFLSPPLP